MAWLWSPAVSKAVISPPFVGIILWNSTRSPYPALLLYRSAETNRFTTLHNPDPLLLGSLVAYKSAYSQCTSQESETSMKWRGTFSKWCSSSMLVGVRVPLEIHSKSALEIHGSRKIWVCWSSGFYIWWPAASDPGKPDSVVIFSDHFPPLQWAGGSEVWGSDGIGSHKNGCEGVGCSSHLRHVMELVVKITRLYSVERGCVLEKGRRPEFQHGSILTLVCCF